MLHSANYREAKLKIKSTISLSNSPALVHFKLSEGIAFLGDRSSPEGGGSSEVPEVCSNAGAWCGLAPVGELEARLGIWIHLLAGDDSAVALGHELGEFADHVVATLVGCLVTSRVERSVMFELSGCKSRLNLSLLLPLDSLVEVVRVDDVLEGVDRAVAAVE